MIRDREEVPRLRGLNDMIEDIGSESADRGGILQRLRRDKGLSQQDLADRVSLSRSRIQQFEAGHAIPTEVLRRIADELGVSPSELIDGAQDRRPPPSHTADNAKDISSKLASLAVRNPRLGKDLYELGNNYLLASSHQLFLFGQQLFEQTKSVFSGFSAGSLTISHPSSIHLWTTFLESERLGPGDVIEAVTVGETHAWWKSPDGEAYNELNLSLADAGVTIVRIFMVASAAELLSLREPIILHLERKIPCYVLAADPSMEVPVFLVISTKKGRDDSKPGDQSGSAHGNSDAPNYQLLPRRFAALQTIRRNAPATTRFSDDIEQCRAAHVLFQTIKRRAYQMRAEDAESLGAVAAALGLPDTATSAQTVAPWTSYMRESNLNRYYFSNSFDCVNGVYHDEHVAAIKRRVKFEWLLCEARLSAADRGCQTSADDRLAGMVARYKDSLLASNVSSQQIKDQITIRVLPRKTVGGVVSWDDFLPLQATFFDTELCVLAPPDWSGAHHARLPSAIVLLGPSFNDLYRRFVTLCESCPTYEQWIDWCLTSDSDDLRMHRLRTLYAQFATSISDHIGRVALAII